MLLAQEGEGPLRRQRQPEHGHRSSTPRRARRSRRSAPPSTRRRPPGSTPSSLACRPTSRSCSSPTPTPTTWPSSTSRSRARARRWGSSRPAGIRPRVRVARDGKTLFVANGKGATSKANRDGPNPLSAGGNDNRPASTSPGCFQGTLSTIPMPGPKQMAAYTRTVYECSPLKKDDPTAVAGPRPAAGNPIPGKVGDPSPITHCVYIIKENRTYDQVFGDMPEGNGEPSLCLFPEGVTPEPSRPGPRVRPARQLLRRGRGQRRRPRVDDGGLCERLRRADLAPELPGRPPRPLSGRGGARRSPGPPAATSGTRAAEKGVSYRSYGEFIENGKTADDPATTEGRGAGGPLRPQVPQLRPGLSRRQKRADRFLEELAEFEAKGEMPRLIVLRLPNDHTSGTRPRQADGDGLSSPTTTWRWAGSSRG